MMGPQAGNQLLNSLSFPTREAVKHLCTQRSLPVNSLIYRANQTVQGLYFLTAGAASYSVRLTDGRSAEVDFAGTEGVVGCGALIGQPFASSDCTMQVAGSSLFLPLTHANAFFQSQAEFRSRILESVQHTNFQVSQMAACNLLHEAEPRLARWLLTASDRCQTNRIAVTQKILSTILGTQRSTVALVAGRLQQRSLISSTRGFITLEDRPGLERIVCECYAATRNAVTALYR